MFSCLYTACMKLMLFVMLNLFIVYRHFCYVHVLLLLCQKFCIIGELEDFQVYRGGGGGKGGTFCVILKIKKFEFFREGPEPPPPPSWSMHVLHWLEYKLLTNIALYWNESVQTLLKEKEGLYNRLLVVFMWSKGYQ